MTMSSKPEKKVSYLIPHASYSYGFTLIELLVTIAIFVFMTALILARYNSFDSGTLLTNLAYDTALTIRQAQTYGLSVVTSDPANPSFSSAYGVDFNSNTPSSFIFFADNNVNHLYNNTGDTIVSTYNMKQGAKISNLCVGNGSCTDNSLNSLDITFQRPDPAAIIYSGSTQYTFAQITLTSADDSASHVVTVRQNGQISVQ